VIPGSVEVNGVVKAKGFIQYSDIRLKTNFEDVVDSINIVSQLSAKKYNWKVEELDNAVGGRKVIGLIAQEVQRVLPEVVSTDPETGLLSVSYIEIIPVLLAAFNQHMRDYKVDKEDIRIELNELRGKMTQLEQDSRDSRLSLQFRRFSKLAQTPTTAGTTEKNEPSSPKIQAKKKISLIGMIAVTIMMMLAGVTLVAAAFGTDSKVKTTTVFAPHSVFEMDISDEKHKSTTGTSGEGGPPSPTNSTTGDPGKTTTITTSTTEGTTTVSLPLKTTTIDSSNHNQFYGMLFSGVGLFVTGASLLSVILLRDRYQENNLPFG